MNKRCRTECASKIEITVYWRGTKKLAGRVEMFGTVCPEHEESFMDFLSQHPAQVLQGTAEKLGLDRTQLEPHIRVDLHRREN